METEEPARVIGLIVAAVSTVLGVLVTFGVSITAEQQKATVLAVGAVLTALAAVGSLVQGKWTRGNVVPLAKYDRDTVVRPSYLAGDLPPEDAP